MSVEEKFYPTFLGSFGWSINQTDIKQINGKKNKFT